MKTTVGILILVVGYALALKTCVQRVTPGKDPRIECVCNSTYCDEVPPLGTLSRNQAALYRTSISGKRFERTDVQLSSKSETSKLKTISLTLDDTNKYQSIIGFGAAFTDAAGINLQNLSPASQENFLQAYFGEFGINYQVSRVPVASTDFSVNVYSYDDTSNDFNMTDFKLTNEDMTYKIPFIKRAKEIQKDLKLFSTPWSAPGWMKTNGNMVGHGTLIGNPGGDYYQAFALYYYKFFEAYHQQGIDFWGLTVLNEPFSDGGWQIMNMTAEMERDFVKMNLGPLLRSNNITKDLVIMIHDDQRTTIRDFSKIVLADPDTSKYVGGIAVHYYLDANSDPHILTDVHNDHPDKFILPTEACTGFTSINDGGMQGDWGRALVYSYDILTDLQNWATGWTDWNICLSETGGPNWINNFVDAPITISNKSDEFYKQPMYYAMGHFSKFLIPGSQRVDLTFDNYDPNNYLEAVGFVTPNNQRVAVFDNRQKSDPYTIAIKDKQSGKTVQFDMEPRSYATVIWNNP
ncbi:hypothetical protein FO519_004849 [Halicephalobus sp. NKZ332]|nr:hypothetical protein FO519_004849 [Halicephalobus sp. NKZ332]